VPTPAYAFAYYLWEAWPGWPQCRPLSLESFVPEWALALDPYAPGLRASLREAMAEARERLDRRADAAWEVRDAFCQWFQELRGRWPPGRICERNFVAGELLPRQILEFRVDPAVPPPWGWAPARVPVSREALWRSVARACGLLGDFFRDYPLLFAEYGADEFAAVFGMIGRGGKRGVRVNALLVCRERYGEEPALGRVEVRGEDLAQELRRAAAGLPGGGGSG
jgi:hypothetical protein